MSTSELLEVSSRASIEQCISAICVDVAIEPLPGRLILISRDEHFWSLPGCRLSAGESPRDAAMRAARDETGLMISLHERLSKYSFVDAIGNCVGHSTLFAAKGYGESAVSNGSILVREFSIQELPRMTSEHAEMVADYLRWSSKGIRPELLKRLVSTRSLPSDERRAA